MFTMFHGRARVSARLAVFAIVAVFALIATPSPSFACACGCGIFDVGTASLLPSAKGGVLSFEYDVMNQNRNWSGTSRADASTNDDKKIRTSFYTAGVQYMFNRSWGVQVKVPYWTRAFTTDTGGGTLETFRAKSVGDVRISGFYTGFSADMSSGVTFGVKLPTGEHDAAGFDRDTQIGTGSTDILLGAFTRGHTPLAGLDWFAQTHVQVPVIAVGGYRPGADVNASFGASYNAGAFGAFGKVAPMLQLIASRHLHDRGTAAEPAETGYTRLLLAPGLELSHGRTTLYADVEIPLYDDVRGNQLVSAPLFKAVVSYKF